MTRKEIKDWAKQTVNKIMHGSPATEEFTFTVGTDPNKTLFGPILKRLWRFVKGNEPEITIHIKRH